MMHITAPLTIALLGLLAAAPAQADPATGYFIARDACPAFQSFRNQTNPGNIRTEADRAYEIIEINSSADPSHYRLLVPGVSPRERWVAIECGIRALQAGDQPTSAAGGGPSAPASSGSTQAAADDYVLAASWQPGFCETQPDKVECLAQDEARFDASHFALHGLWPQPRGREYCGVDEATKAKDKPATWRDLPEVVLSAATRAALVEVMPGTASFLERHEWIVHGTCYGEEMESYFAESVALMAALNASPLVAFLRDNIDQSVTPNQIRAAFDAAFGAGAGKRVKVQCKQEQDGTRTVLTELQIALTGNIETGSDLAALILAAPTTDANAGQCPSVVIDRAGL